MKNVYSAIFFLFLLSSQFLLLPLNLFSQQINKPFNSDNWQVYNGEFVEHMGRQCLDGTAGLKDVTFTNGIIEFDMVVSGSRSYPGMNFRMQSFQDYESFYVRPHRAGLYTDALQYTPSFNGNRGWQLYSGEGFTAGYDIPKNEWVHYTFKISGDRAVLYLNNDEEPALMIDNLMHGESTGNIVLTGQRNGTAYFSDFSIIPLESVDLPKPGKKHPVPGIISEWEISKPSSILKMEVDEYPGKDFLDNLEWEKVIADARGIIDVSMHYARTSNEPDGVYARKIIDVEEDTRMEFRFGYSDAVVIFLNDQLLFTGASAYQQRDPSFLGIIGLNDILYLNLKKGKNEILMLVVESFGGWGFMAQDGQYIINEISAEEQWKSDRVFSVSESVLYDPERDVLYVSNFDQFNINNPNKKQSLSKMSLDGEILEKNWIQGLNNPLGMTIYNDKIYSAERNSIAIIDIENREIIDRIEIPESIFLNDIAIDKKGNIYISDSRKNVIWKYDGTEVTKWLSEDVVPDPNVMYVHNNKLFVGCSGDHYLKSFDLKSKEMALIANLGPGFIDGFRIDQNGNYLVSLWKGRLFSITPDGKITKIMDTTVPQYYMADFEYIPEKETIYFPTFFDNRVHCYKIKL